MSPSEEIAIAGLVVRPHEHVVVAHGVALKLTSREFEIVMKLVEHPGWVFSAEQLSADDEADDYSPESVSVLVSRLRHKLGEAGVPDVIETVRGFGYRLRVPSGDAEPDLTTGTGAHRALRDASWRLQEAVFEVEHLGNDEQREAAVDALEDARRAIFASLAE